MEGLINVLKRFQNVIIKGLANFKKSPKERLTIEYIETRQELLEKDWDSFKETNTQIYQKFKLDDTDQTVVDIYDTTEDTYIMYKSILKTALNKISPRESVQRSDGSSNSSFKSASSFVKLPKIAIPIFSGKYEEWTTFRDLFISLVHKNESLDNVQKLHYLKSHLSGEADQLIRNTPITDANYTQCWDLLDKRYSNKRYLANCILKRLFGIRRMQIESATSLKELLDTTSDCLNALSNLGINVSTWDVIIIHIVTFKLDAETRKQWEISVSSSISNDFPTVEQLKLFLEQRFRAYECIEPKKSSGHQVNNSSNHHTPKTMLATNASHMKCEFCSEAHKLCFCKKFAKQSLEARRDFVRKNRICFNCLGSNHTVKSCKKDTRCRVCQKRHHSLLHLNSESAEDQDPEAKPTADSASPSTSANQIVTCLSTGKVPKPRQVLLATALLKAESKTGGYQTVRALLDQGSQACFITEAAVQFLNLKKIPIQGFVLGLGDNRSTMTKYMVQLTIKSRVDFSFKFTFNAYVLSKITSYLPERSLNTDAFDWLKVNNLCLADPDFNTPNKIDILLGADVHSYVIKEGLVKSPSGSLVAQNTRLGWVLSGAVAPESNSFNTINVMHCKVQVDDILNKCWEIEEQTKRILTPEEKKCDELYSETTNRESDGRYIVRLPFRDEDPPCKSGNLRGIAKSRFQVLETIKNHEVKKQLDQTRTNRNKDKIIGQTDIIQNKEIEKIEHKEEKELEIKLDSTIKNLGLTWNRNEDTFQYSVNLPPLTTAPVTKRTIISDIARLFDPLGWLAPSVVLAKTFIQKLWLADVSWDEALNTELINEWSTYREELSLLSKVRIPRWLGSKSHDDLELHGFSDASKTAYSAVIYLRIVDVVGNVHISLLVAKTRVAPIKQISIPRLELCGAVLLSNLLIETADVLNISRDKIKAWTDSTVVLAWLNSHPSRWKTFVANRTSEVLTTMKASQWFHVKTKDNPADCASRGILPSALIDNSLWFSGPPFLTQRTIIYKRPNDLNIDLEETTKTHIAVVPELSLFERYSSLPKLVRVIAYCRRFVSRRGHCAKIWSDNGTTFVGASRELQHLASIQAALAEQLEAKGTEWHFIPPHSPNFGGLWEAGVKSTKFHLKRVIGDATLTYEEMSTLLNQVEACLNSRPMSVINVTDPGELIPLTPGHFLIGEPIVNVPDHKYECENVSYLSRWQFIQRMLQSFWKRWSQEYLSNLMNRYKWSSKIPEPKIGDIVLVKEDDLPPSSWLLGRVVEKHPGADNITRVVTLRTKSSTIKRPTSKLCILPVVDH